MTLKEICEHERAGMRIRCIFGFDQHDCHIWAWLVEMLRTRDGR